MKLTAHPLAAPLPDEGTGVELPVDRQLMLRLRISLALLLTRGDQLASTFYTLLFERHPRVRPLFPTDISRQQSKLTQTLVWIVTHLHRREQVIPMVRELGQRHVAYGATTEDYPIVRDTLIEAMRRTAGPHWDGGLAEDWRVCFDLIARQMQDRI
jgi:eukaryotic-like serine/threonine-protein kinase